MNRILTSYLVLMWSINLGFSEKPLVVASASIFADMAHQIGGDLIEVSSIVPIGSDPHQYEAKPSDVALLKSADLLLVNGLTFEGWINDLIANATAENKVVLITKGIVPLGSDLHSNSTDPHAWMSAANGLIYIDNIYQELVKIIDINDRQKLKNQYNAFRSKIENLDAYITEQIKTIPIEKRILITSHDAFQYFGRAYGLRLLSTMGISTESDIRTSDLYKIIDEIKKNKVPAIFIENTLNPKVINQIANDTGVAIGGELYADSVGDENSGAETYLDMLKKNTDTIVAGLTKPRPINKIFNSSSFLIMYSFIIGFMVFSILFMIRKLNYA
jgi:ABC-type Zn uptake system ZnuABC Zn-binding protein ZnuA